MQLGPYGTPFSPYCAPTPGMAIFCLCYAKSIVSVLCSFSLCYVQVSIPVVCSFSLCYVQSLVCVKCSLQSV